MGMLRKELEKKRKKPKLLCCLPKTEIGGRGGTGVAEGMSFGPALSL